MEAATGGFRSLRCHVKAAKDAESEAERREGGDREEAAQTVELQRQRLWEEEQQLNGLRIAVAKQQKVLQEHERALRLDEKALQDAEERTAHKERQLDDRIAEIARLEARLHEALLQYNTASSPQHQNNAEYRETQVVLQEQELALLRERIEQRDKQLTTKERILRDKEAEFTACTLKFESIIEEQTKSAAKSTQMHEIMTSREAEFKAEQQAWEELRVRHQTRMEQQKTQLERREAEIFFRESNAEKMESVIADKEAAIEARELAYVRADKKISEIHQQLEQWTMGVEDYLARCLLLIDDKLRLLNDQAEATNQERLSFQEAEARLHQRENRLRVLAKDVELQHKVNLQKQCELDNELSKARLAEEPEIPRHTKPQQAAVPTEQGKLRPKGIAKKAKSTSNIR